MILVSIITFLGNSLVIYAIKTERRLQTVSNYFICSLAVADTLIGIYVMPMSIIYFVGDFKWKYGLVLCQMWLSVDYVSCTSSIFNLFILSLDRYWSVRNPLQYIRKRTSKRAALMISIVWCLSCTWIVAIVFWHEIVNGGVRIVPEDDCDTEFYNNQYFKIFTALINFYIPMIFMIVLYGSIYREIRKRSQMEVGKMNTARTCNDRYQNSSPMQAHLDGENGAMEGLLTPEQKKVWNQEFDSGSSSRNTSGDSEVQTDSVESSRLSDKRKPKIDNQLRSISQMAFVTTGIAGFIHYPDGTADDIASRYFPLNGNNHIPTLMKVQEVSNEGENSQSEHHVSSEAKDSDKQDSKGSESSKHERIPLRDIKSAPEPQKSSPTPRKSILRPTNSCSDTDRIRLSTPDTTQRKISFSLESSSKNRKNASRDELEPLKGRQNSIDSGVGGMKKAHRMKNRLHGPRYSLPNGHDSLQRSVTSDDSQDLGSHNSLFSQFRVSFARFSVRKNRTREVLRNRIKRFSVHRERKAVKQLGIIVGCFITCWLPYFVSFLIIAFKPHFIPSTAHYALIWLGYLNSTFNPFIYPMCNGNFRKAFRRILRIPTASH
ncbi:Histamine H1 receptor [Holothuria leucospilota]|uniref:Histamine H1 receptor n=1 Tax=Holothuria leucospilota TaxID=206669 RepID=A0A9Q1CJZ1_HOLLE|nr:Histamine H1 receptor [Holothuria leucospilota]